MQYTYPDNIYPILYNQQVILLDILKNNYMVMSEVSSSLYIKAIESKKANPNDKILQYFLNIGILKLIEEGEKRKKLKKIQSKGVTTVNWQIRYGDLDIPVNRFEILKAYFYLIKVHKTIKQKRMYGLIELIKQAKKLSKTYTIPSQEKADLLTTIVNRAAFYYPKKTKCLEWAATYVLLAIQKGWKANLVIGVQNYPFLAHAWPEIDNLPAVEHRIVSKGLGQILSLPFDDY